MRILMINKFFFIKGGSETYYFSLKELLEKNGNEVIDFSMKDEKNFDSQYSSYFVDNIDYNKKQNLLAKLKLGIKIVYSYEAKEKLENLIQETKPDIAHLHIFQHQLTSSIIDVLKKYNIPIVYTAHDLKMLCPNYKMLNNELEVCEKCKNSKYYNCFKNKCIKKSYAKSFIGMCEAYFNKYRKNYEKIDYILTPSEFYRRKFIEFGIDKNKIEHLPNFLCDSEIEYEKKENSNYYLYFGRLSEEKGIMTLIKATQDAKINLKIVGTGPEEENIKKYIVDHNLKNIKMYGFKKGKELYTFVANAKCVVIPSEWYENGPYSAIETLKLGVPIIGADIGGIPELINNNGFTFKCGDIQDLKKTINKFEGLSSNKLKEYSENSKKIFNNVYNEDKHYKRIIKIYKDLLEKEEGKSK